MLSIFRDGQGWNKAENIQGKKHFIASINVILYSLNSLFAVATKSSAREQDGERE